MISITKNYVPSSEIQFTINRSSTSHRFNKSTIAEVIFIYLGRDILHITNEHTRGLISLLRYRLKFYTKQPGLLCVYSDKANEIKFLKS